MQYYVGYKISEAKAHKLMFTLSFEYKLFRVSFIQNARRNFWDYFWEI